jgi:putative tryptophan/tyrosine transport system substrate-binding protein
MEAQVQIGAFRQELEKLGWGEGGNIRIDDRWAAGDLDRLRRYATELVSLKPDVILGYGTPPVAALQQATRTSRLCS